MFLAIDIGNTHTVIGLYRKNKLIADWRIISSLHRTEDEIGIQIKSFLHEKNVSPKSVKAVGIASVVPNQTDCFVKMSEKYFKQKPMIVDASLNLGIKIHYADSRAVGADRLCNAIAGFKRFGGPLIIIDFGTATTYDVIASNGDYLGGVIAPGIETSAMDLHRRAAKLPKIELHFPKDVVGTDTVSSMQSGILFGAIDSTNGMIKRIQAEVYRREKEFAKVIATGGFSSLLNKHTDAFVAVIPSLVLDGIRLICERVKRKK